MTDVDNKITDLNFTKKCTNNGNNFDKIIPTLF